MAKRTRDLPQPFENQKARFAYLEHAPQGFGGHKAAAIRDARAALIELRAALAYERKRSLTLPCACGVALADLLHDRRRARQPHHDRVIGGGRYNQSRRG